MGVGEIPLEFSHIPVIYPLDIHYTIIKYHPVISHRYGKPTHWFSTSFCMFTLGGTNYPGQSLVVHKKNLTFCWFRICINHFLGKKLKDQT